jgi:hypothetical protein
MQAGGRADERPIRSGATGTGDLPVKCGELVAQRQDLGVLGYGSIR